MLLSLDVGFAHTGFVLWEGGEIKGFGTITTVKSKNKMARTADDNAFRAAQIALSLKDVIVANKVKGIVGEMPHGGAKNARAMAAMAMATGIISAVAAVLEIPVEWTTPTDVKLAVIGKKKAEKDEIMDAIRARFPKVKFPPEKTNFEHVADAVGAYLACRSGNLVKIFG